jgi:hypothetical protein
MFENPSLICEESGLSIGSDFSYFLMTGKYNLLSGFLGTFNKNGYSICFLKDTRDEVNRISAGYAFSHKRINAGASFHYVFSSIEPSFLFDVGAVVRIKKHQSLQVAVKNIITNDSIKIDQPFLIAGGPEGEIPFFKRAKYSLQAAFSLAGVYNRMEAFGGAVALTHFFFHNPSLLLYYKADVMRTMLKKFSLKIEVSPGFYYQTQSYTVGMYIGGAYYSSVNRTNPAITVSMFLNLLYGEEVPMLSGNLLLSTDDLSPDNDGNFDAVIITIRGSFYNSRTKLKQWTLIIFSEKNNKKAITCIFSGGSIIPSSIVWDGRNRIGELLDDGVYKIQLILIDTFNREVSAASKEITVH